MRKLILFSSVAGVFISGFSSIAQAQYTENAAAAMEIRFQQLEKEIRRLTGQIEEQNYEIRSLKEELSKVSGDVQVRLNDLEGGRPSAGVPAPVMEQPKAQTFTSNEPVPQGVEEVDAPQANNNTVQPLGTLSQNTESGSVKSKDKVSSAYDYAYSFIKARDFERAEVEFAKFMTDYPNVPLVSNAQYWYGETFYVRGQYEKAARIFAEGYQKYPQGPKAASNLLKLGMSLSGLDKNEDACIAYQQLQKEYSNSSVPVLKRAETEMKKIGCN